jgi:hypothetical protein
MREVPGLHLAGALVEVRNRAGDRTGEFRSKDQRNDFDNEQCDGRDDQEHDRNRCQISQRAEQLLEDERRP